jgi:hypothetical protein
MERAYETPLRGAVVAMEEYRVYTVGPDGHIIGVEAMVCANDEEAIKRTKRLVDSHDVELWSGSRLVIRLPGGTN